MYTYFHGFGTQNQLQNGPKTTPGGPGGAKGLTGVSRGLPGGSWRAIWAPQGPPRGAIWAPFWVPFWLHFSFKFRGNFFKDFGTHSGSIWPPFWEPKSTSEALRRDKVDLQKPLFSLSKTILFELGGSPELPKSLPEAT